MMLMKIQKNYPDSKKPLFQNLSLELKPGRLVALLGPSGVGKTTLLLILALMESFDAGTFCIAGESVQSWSKEKRAAWRRHHLGFMPQHSIWMQHLSMQDNLMLRASLTGYTLALLQSTLKEWGLEGLAHRNPRQLSGGQLQRMAWIRASIHRPTFILADEPTSHLDVENADHFVSAARLCTAAGCAVLLSTHQNSLAAQCDEVWHLTAEGLIHVS